MNYKRKTRGPFFMKHHVCFVLDLEEGEISTSVKQEPRTVKLEPRMLGDEDLQDCKLGRRAGKRCYCASDPASANSPHSRNYKRSRPSKDHTTSGPPGWTADVIC